MTIFPPAQSGARSVVLDGDKFLDSEGKSDIIRNKVGIEEVNYLFLLVNGPIASVLGSVLLD